MTNIRRNALICTLALAVLAAFFGGCDNDVPTPPWLPNYTASGYGGKGGTAGKGGGTSVGAAGQPGEAGQGGDSSAGGSSGEAGDGP